MQPRVLMVPLRVILLICLLLSYHAFSKVVGHAEGMDPLDAAQSHSRPMPLHLFQVDASHAARISSLVHGSRSLKSSEAGTEAGQASGSEQAMSCIVLDITVHLEETMRLPNETIATDIIKRRGRLAYGTVYSLCRNPIKGVELFRRYMAASLSVVDPLDALRFNYREYLLDRYNVEEVCYDRPWECPQGDPAEVERLCRRRSIRQDCPVTCGQCNKAMALLSLRVSGVSAADVVACHEHSYDCTSYSAANEARAVDAGLAIEPAHTGSRQQTSDGASTPSSVITAATTTPTPAILAAGTTRLVSAPLTWLSPFIIWLVMWMWM